MKIILSGGGTLGPVIPLLAIAEAYRAKYPNAQFVWVGTPNGPERALVEEARIPFASIGAGKWRRYFSLLNVLDIFRNIAAFFQSIIIIVREKPDLLISCGGFVSVPLHWAGALMAVPAWVHQQDIRLGFANKLMFPFAKKVTTALRDSVAGLPEKKTEWIGNPVRDLSVKDVVVSRMKFKIPEGAPVILAMGGGTGSTSINNVVIEALPLLSKKWHIINLVGKERSKEGAEKAADLYQNYHALPFLTDQMKDAYAIADVIIARAGFSTLTELAALSKAAIIMPMYGTHQEDNAKQFADHDGIILLEKGNDMGIKLAQMIKDLVEIPEKRQELGENLHRLLPRTKSGKIVEIIDELIKQ